ncbi:hypothetical protein MMC18_004797 [Xylographa bjoerkii]|nr:hypothetical protein [Xylographa bjoerkii]
MSKRGRAFKETFNNSKEIFRVEPSELCEHLTLALDTDKSPRFAQDFTWPVLPPIIMDWSVNSLGGWRDWDPAADEQSEQCRTAQHSFNMLRGSFVDVEQRFSIPIRSGLDWRKKAFVYCA